MGKHLRTSPKSGWTIASIVALIVVVVAIVVWAYGFVVAHPGVWGRRPNLIEGLAVMVSVLAPLSVLAFAIDCVFLPKRKGRVSSRRRENQSTDAPSLVSR